MASINPELVRSLFVGEGLTAFRHGKKINRNPYRAGDVEYDAWRVGWLQGLQRRLVTEDGPRMLRRRTDRA